MKEIINAYAMVAFRHIAVLAFEEMRDIFSRIRAIMALGVYLLSVLLIVYGFSQIDSAFSEMLTYSDSKGRMFQEIMKKLSFPKLQEIFERVEDWPLAFPLFQFYMLLWLPTFISLVSCDMISADTSRGTLRFLFLKTTRFRYYLSKLVAHFLLYFSIHIVSLLLLLGGLLYYADREIVYADYVEPIALLILMFIPFCLFVLSSICFISAVSKGAFSALIKVHLFWLCMFAVMVFVPKFPLSAGDFFGIVFPFKGYGIQASITLSLWSILFGLLGIFLFNRREI